ncbi:lysophospholipid acyltransferase family protein [Inhella sp.]|uniref:lysophospholipid acyltransferase family protein n=1 Tax=Inhella sp. TaxID=1921806 RepID=UPI0035AE1E15
MFLFRLCSRLPLWLLHLLGGWLGWLSFLASPSYRRRLLAHARMAGASPWGAVAQAGRMLAEIPWLWLRPATTTLPLHWDGAEKVEAALAGRQGLLLLTPHMGCFEAAAQALAERFGATQPITVLYRPARKPYLRELVAAGREREHLRAAPAQLSGVRQMLRALRGGEMVGLLPDQVPPEGQGVWAPFFGQPAFTMTLAARLVQQTGCAVLTLWCERLPLGQGFVVHVRDFPPLAPEATAEQAATAINQAMERLILERPAQYLWGYNRYKAPRAADGG